jgi:hypothetical protein
MRYFWLLSILGMRSEKQRVCLVGDKDVVRFDALTKPSEAVQRTSLCTFDELEQPYAYFFVQTALSSRPLGCWSMHFLDLRLAPSQGKQRMRPEA